MIDKRRRLWFGEGEGKVGAQKRVNNQRENVVGNRYGEDFKGCFPKGCLRSPFQNDGYVKGCSDDREVLDEEVKEGAGRWAVWEGRRE